MTAYKKKNFINIFFLDFFHLDTGVQTKKFCNLWTENKILWIICQISALYISPSVTLLPDSLTTSFLFPETCGCHKFGLLPLRDIFAACAAVIKITQVQSIYMILAAEIPGISIAMVMDSFLLTCMCPVCLILEWLNLHHIHHS